MGARLSKNKEMANTPAARQAVIVAPRLKHTGSIIFLHGLGDTGDGWAAGFKQLGFSNIRCVCPNAPVQPVTLNGGMKMPSWYDIQHLRADSPEDEKGIKLSSKNLQEVIRSEEALGIPSNRIIVGGFSQGGALALYTALIYDKPLAGIVGLSTYLPLRDSFPSMATEANLNSPIFQGHGHMDQVIPHGWGDKTHKILGEFRSKDSVTLFKSYASMGHSSCDEEMKDVKAFIEKYLPD